MAYPGLCSYPCHWQWVFAMIASFLLSQTFVPVMGNWLMKHHLSNKERSSGAFDRFKNKYAQHGCRLQGSGGVLTVLFVVLSIGAVILLFSTIGTELFPANDTGQTQVRLRL